MICTVDVDIQSANPDFPLKEWKAFKDSPTSLRIRNVPRKVGAWDITEVNVKCVYPDNTAHMVAAVLTGCVWVATIPASHAVGFVEGGYSIEADGTDERGNVVTGYRLGEGNVTILDVAASAHAVDGIEFMRVFDTKPDDPHKGDFALDTAEIYDGEEWRAFSAPSDYSTVRANAATGAAHAAETGNPHGTSFADLEGKPDIPEVVDPPNATREGQAADAMATQTYLGQQFTYIQNVGESLVEHIEDDGIHFTNETEKAEFADKYTKEEVDEKISQNAAHYLTSKVGGAFVPFATHAALAAAKAAHTDENPQFWYGDDPHTPDKNDYLTVLDDETHDHATTRYMFVGMWPDGFFRYQYTVNETALTHAQWDALNSGATKAKIDAIDGKIDKADFEGYELEAKYLPISGGEETYGFDWSSHTVERDEDGFAIYDANGEVGPFFDSDGIISNYPSGLLFGGKSPDATWQPRIVAQLDIASKSELVAATKLTPVKNSAGEIVGYTLGDKATPKLITNDSLIAGVFATPAFKEQIEIGIETKTASFTAEDGKRYTVASMPATLAVTLPSYAGDAAKVAHIFEARFDGSALTADASVTFVGATATTMDTDCGTVKSGKIALMSAFWNGATWDISWKVQG